MNVEGVFVGGRGGALTSTARIKHVAIDLSSLTRSMAGSVLTTIFDTHYEILL